MLLHGDEENVALVTVRLSEDPTAWPVQEQRQDQWAGRRDESVPDPALVANDSLSMGMVCLNARIQPAEPASVDLEGAHKAVIGQHRKQNYGQSSSIELPAAQTPTIQSFPSAQATNVNSTNENLALLNGKQPQYPERFRWQGPNDSPAGLVATCLAWLIF